MPSLLRLSLFGLGASALGIQNPIAGNEKHLVGTAALQADIKSDSLLKRATELFDIAKLSEDEFNHPTRVIGSKGLNFIFDFVSIAHQEMQGMKLP